MISVKMPTQLLPLDRITELSPAFCNGYGWLSLTELNLIDPNDTRFEIVEWAEFIDGSTFVCVTPQ